MAEENQTQHQRKIKSYVKRCGRLTEAQEKGMTEYWPNYGLDPSESLSLSQSFKQSAPTVIEVGFGMGDSLLDMASKYSHFNFVGIEVHTPGVGRLVNEAHKLGLTNLKVYNHDAVEVLENSLANNSFRGFQLFFPDPWHKKRHHKRRIMKPDFIDLVVSKLEVGGYFHVATDWEPYAIEILELLDNTSTLSNQAGKGKYSPKPEYRIETKFEKRGFKLGHGSWDIIFIKK